MKPERKKCQIMHTMIPGPTTGTAPTPHTQCSTHAWVFQFPIGADRCPIGRLEDIEARLESIEDAVLDVTRAFSRVAEDFSKSRSRT